MKTVAQMKEDIRQALARGSKYWGSAKERVRWNRAKCLKLIDALEAYEFLGSCPFLHPSDSACVYCGELFGYEKVHYCGCTALKEGQLTKADAIKGLRRYVRALESFIK